MVRPLKIFLKPFFQLGLPLLILNSLLILAWSKYGMALSVDSANYASVAENLVAGKGFMQFDGLAFFNAAPLYPLLLSLGVFIGIPVLQTGIILQLLAINTILFVLFLVTKKMSAGKASTWIVCLSGMTYFGFQHAYLFLLSESVFMAFFSVWIYLISYGSDNKKTNRLSAILLACMCLLRYAGFMLLPGIILFWIWKRKKRSYVFFQLFPTLLALSIWFIRNHTVAGSFLGAHDLENKLNLSGFFENLQVLFYLISHKPGEVGYLILFFLLWLFAGILLGLKKEAQSGILLPVFLLSGSYLLLLFMQSNLSFLQLPRYLSFFWPFVFLTIPMSLQGFGLNSKATQAVLITLCLFQILALGKRAILYSEQGAGGFHNKSWQNPILQESLWKAPQGEWISNFPDMVWWMSHKNCLYTPFLNEIKANNQSRLQGGKILIWYKNKERDHVMAPEQEWQYKLIDPIYENEFVKISRIEFP